jgi:hypothetical protein
MHGKNHAAKYAYTTIRAVQIAVAWEISLMVCRALRFQPRQHVTRQWRISVVKNKRNKPCGNNAPNAFPQWQSVT